MRALTVVAPSEVGTLFHRIVLQSIQNFKNFISQISSATKIIAGDNFANFKVLQGCSR